jgi:hypothetical protein
MKNHTIFAILILCCSFFSFPSLENQPVSYYFNASLGDDSNKGISSSQAWKSLSKIKELKLKPGDQILLASGITFEESINLKDVRGTKELPILISTYGNKHQKAYVNSTGELNALHIQNSSFIEIKNLSLTASKMEGDSVTTNRKMRCGILFKVTKPYVYEHIYLKNIKVSNIFFENKYFSRPKNEIKTANGTQNYGWGIRFINNSKEGLLKDIRLDSILVENVGHTGIKLTSINNNNYGIVDFQISNSRVLKTGGPGIQMSGVKNGHVFNNFVDHSGSNDDTRKWGRGSGLWTWGSANVLIEKNRFTNANGPGDSAGAHIDFNCNNIVLQYNFSTNNAGGFCEILGNNYNCSYRYNISVNDGYRIKGEKGAFQEGKVLWLSGYSGKKRKGPFNSYFYNNTIYVKKEIQTKIAIDRLANGILIANNIFHIEGDAENVKGDQYNPEKKGEWMGQNIFFKNNVYLHQSSWPKEMPLQDAKAFYGNSKFTNLGGFLSNDYIPTNRKLIKNKGVIISKLSKDSIGILYGLHPSKDILGNPIIGLPDLGAIEIE